MTDSSITKKMQLNIAIIGAGKVGQTLEYLFNSNGHNVTLIGRNIDASQQAIKNAKLVLITTSDQAIEQACENISCYLSNDTVVSHCSGALNSDVLLTAKKQGCAIASSHPLNTFPNLAASLATFNNLSHGTYLYCEGDKQALVLLNNIFGNTGFNIVEINSNAKTAYHTACVFACNYLTVLMDLSLQTIESKGMDKNVFWQAVQPLIHSTLNNISGHGTANSLSGPIARGDTRTITSHLELLTKQNSEIGNIYLKLGQHALSLAKQQGKLSKVKLSALELLLKN